MGFQGKVFGLGLSRTGTTSLNKALNRLGITSVHFPHDQTTYEELSRGTFRLSVLEKFQAVTDITVAPYYAQLDAVYPGSKFILTVRALEAWLGSVERHATMVSYIAGHDPRFKQFNTFISGVVYGTLSFQRERFAYVYDTHLRNVTAYFEGRPDDLLIMDITRGEGWEKLCPFLGVPIPDKPFPRSNTRADREAWARKTRQAARELAEVVPGEQPLVLVHGGKAWFRDMLTEGRPSVTFFELKERLGKKPSVAAAIEEVERLRGAGAKYLALAWPAFRWLNRIEELEPCLSERFSRVIKNDRLIVYRLRSEA